MFQEYTSPMFLFITVAGAQFTPMVFILFTTVWILNLKAPMFFYSVCHHICFPSNDHSLRAPTVFILFIAVSVFRVVHRATALHSDKVVESLLS